jgi:hypothetical protein
VKADYSSVMPAPHLQKIMTAQEYIESKLEELKTPSGLAVMSDKDQLVDAIFKAIMSKKFRKYSANDELKNHILGAIKMNVEKNEPINITFLHGAYKLWRLEESPEVDWAELFALLYYSNWLKPVCEIYEPGVWFDALVDDRIIPQLNNIPQSDVDTYIASYQHVLDFLKKYQPANFRMTITPVSELFESPEAHDESVQKNLEVLLSEEGLPKLTDSEKAMVEMNTRVTDEQLKDPEWREKVMALHNAYMVTKREPGYHKVPEKILAFTQPLASGTTISVGSTKDSIMKFWIGVGVLKPREDSYRMIVLSPGQLEDSQFSMHGVIIEGLEGKNFEKVRVLSF